MMGTALAALLLSSPAAAQRMSDGYSFLKAVRDGDGAKASSLAETPGSLVLNYKDPSTGEAAIHEVVKKREARWLSYLLAKGAKADLQSGQGDTPLTLAAQIGWIEGAELLIARKANVNGQDSRGQTPLILAVQKRDVPMVRLLMESGANPKIADRVAGYSALDYAKQDNRAEAVLKIMEQPAKKPKEIVGPKF
jgi:ankyrin repeat protein